VFKPACSEHRKVHVKLYMLLRMTHLPDLQVALVEMKLEVVLALRLPRLNALYHLRLSIWKQKKIMMREIIRVEKLNWTVQLVYVRTATKICWRSSWRVGRYSFRHGWTQRYQIATNQVEHVPDLAYRNFNCGSYRGTTSSNGIAASSSTNSAIVVAVAAAAATFLGRHLTLITWG